MGMEFRDKKCVEVKCQHGDSRNLILRSKSCGIATLSACLWESEFVSWEGTIHISFSILIL